MSDLISRQDAIDALSEDIEDCFVLHDAIKSIQGVPSAQQPYFIQLKNIVSNDDFRRIREDLKHQCENIVLLHEHEQLVYPTQRWIPCSERLPDCEGEYLVTWGTINVRSMCVLHYDQWGDWTDEYDNVMDGSNVVAWMPLPEPYKEDDR